MKNSQSEDLDVSFENSSIDNGNEENLELDFEEDSKYLEEDPDDLEDIDELDFEEDEEYNEYSEEKNYNTGWLGLVIVIIIIIGAINNHKAKKIENDYNYEVQNYGIINKIDCDSLIPENPYTGNTGHYAGYEWGSLGNYCSGNSNSFIEGCQEYENQEEAYLYCLELTQ